MSRGKRRFPLTSRIKGLPGGFFNTICLNSTFFFSLFGPRLLRDHATRHPFAVPRSEDINLLWRLAARTDNRIEPIPCGERQWLEDDASAIIEIARREGETVTIQ
jgi:hypothetical protein